MKALYLLLALVVLASGCVSDSGTGDIEQTSQGSVNTSQETLNETDQLMILTSPGSGWSCGSFKIDADMVYGKPDVLTQAIKQSGFAFIGLMINYSRPAAEQELELCDSLTESGIVCIPTQLFGTQGRIVAIGPREMVPPNMTMEQAIDFVHSRDGIVYISRPMGESNQTAWRRWDITSWDGIAVVSPMTQRRQGDQIALEMLYNFLNNGDEKLAFGETDVKAFTSVYDLRNMIDSSYQCVHVDGNLTEDSLMEAIRSGSFYVTNGPVLNFTVGSVMPGGSVNASYGDEVQLSVDVSSTSVFDTVRIIKNGEVIQEIGKPLNRLTTNLTSTVVKDTWFSVEVWGSDNTPEYHDFVHAISNPVWVRIG